MSWDVYIDNFPLDIERVADIPDDFRPAPLGNRIDLIAKIREVVPDTDFSDPACGVLEARNFCVDFRMGASEVCKSITLEIRGGGNPAAFVAALLDHMKLRAIDCQTSEFFDTEAAKASFADWQRYRDQVLGNKSGPNDESTDHC